MLNFFIISQLLIFRYFLRAMNLGIKRNSFVPVKSSYNFKIQEQDNNINNCDVKSNYITVPSGLRSYVNFRGNAPSVGTSIVQANRTEPTPMSKLRKGEHLHTHPGFPDKSQTEIYMITSGSAALTVVRDGVPQIKVLREGEMAVIPPDTPHCVNSVMGEYEQVVSQVPSAFHYGLAFKQNYDLPYGYSEQVLEEQAGKELLNLCE